MVHMEKKSIKMEQLKSRFYRQHKKGGVGGDPIRCQRCSHKRHCRARRGESGQRPEEGKSATWALYPARLPFTRRQRTVQTSRNYLYF